MQDRAGELDARVAWIETRVRGALRTATGRSAFARDFFGEDSRSDRCMRPTAARVHWAAVSRLLHAAAPYGSSWIMTTAVPCTLLRTGHWR